MEVEIIAEAGFTLARVKAPRLDVASVQDFKNALMPLVKPGAKVLLDLAAVPFVDSSGLGALLSVMRQLAEGKGELRLARLTEQVMTMFVLVKMNKVFDIYNTLAEAEHGWR